MKTCENIITNIYYNLIKFDLYFNKLFYQFSFKAGFWSRPGLELAQMKAGAFLEVAEEHGTGRAL